MSRKFTVLVTCVGGGLAGQLVRSAKASTRHTIRVVGADTEPAPIARRFCDVFAQIPRGTDSNYAEQVLALCLREDVQVVLPGADEEALALARAQAEFERNGIVLACNRLELLEVICDKIATYQRLEALDIPVPM